MSVNETLITALTSSGYQTAKVFAGLPEGLRDERLANGAMSPRETLVHLTDCYHAALTALQDQEYAWGSFEPSSNEWDDLLAAWSEARARAVEEIGSSVHVKAGAIGMGYVALHDAYHVGQIAQYRVVRDPAWDAYSIYHED